MPSKHKYTGTPSCSPGASERWEVELGLSDLRREDFAQIGPVVIAYDVAG